LLLHSLQNGARNFASVFIALLFVRGKYSVLMFSEIDCLLKDALKVGRLTNNIERIERNEHAFENLLKMPISQGDL